MNTSPRVYSDVNSWVKLVNKNYFGNILQKLKMLLQNPGVAQIYLHQTSQENSIVFTSYCLSSLSRLPLSLYVQ